MLPVAGLVLGFLVAPHVVTADVSKEEWDSIQTPDKVETSIGTLEFVDGAPTADTARKAYDYLDRMRGVDAFLKGMPGASLQGLIKGNRKLGAVQCNQVVITDRLMDSKPLFLTANTSTLYTLPTLDLKRDGPTVMEVPGGMLGAFNDAWFRYMQDVGPAGPDQGKGGTYLVLPPGYEGDVPDGYHVVESRTYNVWIFLRHSIAKGVEAAVEHVESGLKIYPLSKKDDPPAMEFISGSGLSWNTIHANNYLFYEHLAEWINYEHLDMLDVETRGLFASIGIEQGKPFQPDARMKAILVDAIKIANATARSIVWYPRMAGAKIYPDSDSAWTMGFVDKNVFFTENGAMNSDARVLFHYPYTAVTPAMATPRVGTGSDYGIAYLDADKKPFDGARAYRLRIPANPRSRTSGPSRSTTPRPARSSRPASPSPPWAARPRASSKTRMGPTTSTSGPRRRRASRGTGWRRCRARAGSLLSECTDLSSRGSRRPGGQEKSSWSGDSVSP